MVELQLPGLPACSVAIVSATAVLRLGVQSTRLVPALLAHDCVIPLPEMKFNVDCVPCAAPLTAIANPDIPAPLQLVRPLAGSSVQPPLVKLRAASTGRAVPAFCIWAMAPFDPATPVGPTGPVAPAAPTAPADPAAPVAPTGPCEPVAPIPPA